ncbi:uncharacterized protein MELLADRAFT_113562 [Melampsora larici-populina 98AG31]|uniref:Uncharacterized protein n=1 Tax=Melampsora larici-populina (strain 98AG31 / pathotype 3-4-7) TaxID=747676 RepID=F4SAB0_MELLP|nr:uncharacterized protein MELLADRAFT_113562 [Melampsora larici-populina 98AG31]EGF98436.1 hypothetical protein MELLADRAFT_113562 [Melampsora larici-populina 98AG31]
MSTNKIIEEEEHSSTIYIVKLITLLGNCTTTFVVQGLGSRIKCDCPDPASTNQPSLFAVPYNKHMCQVGWQRKTDARSSNSHNGCLMCEWDAPGGSNTLD